MDITDLIQEPCDMMSIAAVGCGETDYACHCAHTDQITALLQPCLKKSSNCTSAELQSKEFSLECEVNSEEEPLMFD
jgi:hypothetical protein